MSHPLLEHFLRAARGEFPPADGGCTLLPPLDDGTSAVVGFTAHAFIATSRSADELAGLPLDGYGGANDPRTLIRIAGEGTVGVLDATLVGIGRGGGTLARIDGLDDHPRVRYARSLRTGVVVHGDERGFITLASGLAGRPEISIELPAESHGRGDGRALIAEALGLVEAGTPLFAAISPGNARSLRSFLSCGFVPIGSEVIIRPDLVPPTS